jgi:hypothetical protein
MSEHNMVFLRGTVAGDPRSRDLPSGSVVIQYEVTTRDEAGTASVPVAWFDPPQGRTEVVAERVLAARQRREIERALTDVCQTLAPP